MPHFENEKIISVEFVVFVQALLSYSHCQKLFWFALLETGLVKFRPCFSMYVKLMCWLWVLKKLRNKINIDYNQCQVQGSFAAVYGN